jgi:hypothetical protein
MRREEKVYLQPLNHHKKTQVELVVQADSTSQVTQLSSINN